MAARLSRSVRSIPSLESLEQRTVPTSVGLRPDGTLVIVGTAAADTIDVRQSNGYVQVIGYVAIPQARVSHVLIRSLGGNDTIRLRRPDGALALAKPTTIYAGDGNDHVEGGRANDIVFGENGNDVLDGGFGNDRLFGGNHADTLTGGGGNDRLFGGAGGDRLDGGSGNIDWLEAGSAAEYAVDGWNAHRWSTGADPGDIEQEGTGTCALLAAMAAATDVGINLPARIAYLGHYTYRVQLYSRAVGAWTFRDVVFNGNMVRTSLGRQVDPATTPEGEFWTVLYQRAYMRFCGINPMNGNAVANFGGDDPGRALSLVTGRVVDYDAPFNVTPQSVRARLLRGDAVVAGTRYYPASALVVGGHAYMVDNVYQQGAAWFVRVYNPWGIDGRAAQGTNDGYVVLGWATFLNDFDILTSAVKP